MNTNNHLNNSSRYIVPRQPAVLACLLLTLASTLAADRWWDGGAINIGTTGDGDSSFLAGTWNTTTTNWDQGLGLDHVLWNNANLDNAIFGGTVATPNKTVTLGTAITVNQLVVTAGGAFNYTLGTAATPVLTLGGTYSDSTPAINASALPANGSFTVTARISGTLNGGLVISHGGNVTTPATSGRVYLNTASANDFVGDITVLSGNLHVLSSLGNAANKIYLKGGALFNSAGAAGTITVARDVIVAADSAFAMNGTVAGVIVNLASNKTITGSANFTRYNSGNAGSELRVSGDMSGYTGTVINNGGLLTIQTPATSGGGWVLNGGTLKLNTNNNTHIANGAGKPNLEINGGALNLNGWSETINGLTGTGGFVQNDASGSNSVLTLGDDNATAAYGGTIRNNGSGTGTLLVTKIGNGTQTLSGTNQCAGYTIGGGTLEISDPSGVNPFSSPITNNATLSFNDSGARTHAALITGSGSLTKQGFGALTLTGTNDYAGSTTVSGGTLSMTTAKSGTGAIVVGGGLELNLKRHIANAKITAASATFDSDTVRLDFNLGGPNATPMLDVTGTLNNTGTMNIYIQNAGVLTVGTYPLIKYGSFVDGGGSAFNLAVPISPRVSASVVNNTGTKTIELVVTAVDYLRWTGATDNIWDTTTTNWLLTGSSSPINYADGELLEFTDTGANTVINLGNSFSPGGITVSNTTVPYFFTNSGSLNGSGSLVKSGSGTLTLAMSGGASHSGGTIVQAGTLTLGDGLVDCSISAPMQNNGSVVFDVLSANNPGEISGAGSLTKQGAGALTLDDANSYSGATTVSAGSVHISQSTALGTAASGTTVQGGAEVWVDAGGLNIPEPLTLSGSGVSGEGALVMADFLNASTWGGPLTATGNSLLTVKQGSSLTIPAGINSTNRNLLFSADNTGYFAVSSTISAASITLTNSGGLVLAGANPSVTNLQVLNASPVSSPPANSGLWARDSQALGTNSTVTLTNSDYTGGTGARLGLANNVTIPANVSLVAYCPGDGSAGVGGYRCQLAGATATTNNWNGSITIHGADPSVGIATYFMLFGDNSGTSGRLVVNGNVSVANGAVIVLPRGNGSGQFNGQLNLGTNILQSTDAGRWTVASTGNTWGLTQIGFNQSTLALGVNNALCVSAPLDFLQAGTCDLNGFNQQIAGLSGTGGTIVNTSSNTASTLTLSGANPGTFGGSLVQSAVAGAKSLGLSVINGAALTLTSSNNSYSGLTVIATGSTLALANNGTTDGVILNSPIKVQAGGTLDVSGRSDATFTSSGSQVLSGNGTVNGSVTNNGILSPGESIGILAVTANVTLGATGSTVMEVSNATATKDLLTVVGTLTYDGTLVVTNVSATPYTNNQVIKLFNATGGYVGSFANIVFPGVGTYDATQLTVDGTIKVTSIMATTPTNITMSVSGGNLTLSWPPNYTGWLLQSQTNTLSQGLSSTWYNVPGSTTNNQMIIPIAPGNPTVFFRLKLP